MKAPLSSWFFPRMLCSVTQEKYIRFYNATCNSLFHLSQGTALFPIKTNDQLIIRLKVTMFFKINEIIWHRLKRSSHTGTSAIRLITKRHCQRHNCAPQRLASLYTRVQTIFRERTARKSTTGGPARDMYANMVETIRTFIGVRVRKHKHTQSETEHTDFEPRRNKYINEWIE